jgi:hypothetical protein
MMKEEKKYGKTPSNPILMTSIKDSILFLNSLVTEERKPILYHRLYSTIIGKSKPIDCYEIFKEGGKLEILYINPYAYTNCAEIPEGYLKTTGINYPLLYKKASIFKTIGVNHRLRKFPDDLI